MPVQRSLCVIWIDWYAYHVARFRALAEHPGLQGNVRGVELVGGAGVHRKLVFRSTERGSLPIDTLMPDASWKSAPQSQLVREVWRKLTQLNPAVVLIPGYYTAPGIAAALWARSHGRRSILMTESTREDHARVWWKEMAKRWLLRILFDAAVAGGERHIAYLKELGFSPARIARCYDVVDNGFFSEGARDAQSASRPKGWPLRYFLYVGRMAEEKNLVRLLHSFAQFRRQGGDWSLVLVGDGPERGALEALASEMDLGSAVRFEGQKSTREIVPYYAFASCFVLPSTREPWGLVVNEAMAAGLPAIVSEKCGCADDLIVPNGNGFRFDPTCEPALTESLRKIALLTDSQLRQMGAQSRERVSHYSLERWAEEVYRLVTGSTPRQAVNA